MYSVGIFALRDDTEDSYTVVGEKLGFHIRHISLDDLHNKNEWDVLIIDEEDGCPAYETVLQVRARFNGYLLLRASNSAANDMIYLYLGIDGLIREELTSEVLFIQLKRLFELFGPLAGKNNRTLQQQEKGGESKLTLFPENLSVFKNNEEIELTKKEYAVLMLLMKHEGTAVSYKELYQNIWGGKRADTYQITVANSIFHLRKKLGRSKQGREYIRTIRTKGYLFCQ